MLQNNKNVYNYQKQTKNNENIPETQQHIYTNDTHKT